MAGAPQDPETLLTRARRGSNEALGELLDLYRNYLQLLARTQIDVHFRGRTSASDLVQETCLHACDRFDQFRGNSEKEWIGWLRTILANVLGHAVEKNLLARKRDARRDVSLSALIRDVDRSTLRIDRALASQASSPSQQAERREAAALVADRITRLPPDHREVVVLRNLEGLQFDAIAERMQRSSGAVRMLWLRALEKLRAMDGRSS